ncbi:MAG: hypothetical protein LC109_09910 [Bacteroidia bacterium]|jgi:hypothetical protein|nr:hypothetical protein [Bacteroidia bacterium]
MESNLTNNNLAFHAILERAVNQLEYGQLDITFVLQNGLVALPTINIIKSKRIKFKNGKMTAGDGQKLADSVV